MGSRTDKLEEIHDINREVVEETNAHRDAITGAPGSHPVGTGIGAATAGMAGAALGSVVPGVGTVIGGTVGAVVGAVAGGLAGKAVAESINPTDEHAYWEAAHRDRDYYDETLDYDRDFRAAYGTGIEVYNEDPTRTFIDVEQVLQQRWEARRGDSKLDWDKASRVMRDVYERDRTTDPNRPESSDAKNPARNEND